MEPQTSVAPIWSADLAYVLDSRQRWCNVRLPAWRMAVSRQWLRWPFSRIWSVVQFESPLQQSIVVLCKLACWYGYEAPRRNRLTRFQHCSANKVTSLHGFVFSGCRLHGRYLGSWRVPKSVDDCIRFL